jgi:hypothetical protein
MVCVLTLLRVPPVGAAPSSVNCACRVRIERLPEARAPDSYVATTSYSPGVRGVSVHVPLPDVFTPVVFVAQVPL